MRHFPSCCPCPLHFDGVQLFQCAAVRYHPTGVVEESSRFGSPRGRSHCSLSASPCDESALSVSNLSPPCCCTARVRLPRTQLPRTQLPRAQCPRTESRVPRTSNKL